MKKKSKLLALAAVSLLSVGVLAACSSSKGAVNTYSYVYTGDPDSLDYLVSNKGPTRTVVSNVVDGLMENDQYGNLKPSLAKDWKVSADGLTYTYTLRKGVHWYTSDGEEYAEVKAQDFVTGIKHAVDSESESMYLIKDSIAGLTDYIEGTDKDFSKVGVKALDDYTVQYTLAKPEPYWNSKTTYSVLWPVNEEFLNSQDKNFGKSTDPNTLLYNGPFILKSLTNKSSIEMTKNENYWDKDNVHFDGVKLSYYDGSDQESLERNFTDGVYSLARLYPTSSNYANAAKKYKDNIYVTPPASSVEGIGINIARQTYDHTAKTSDEQKSSTKAAILNKDFRQSLNFAVDRVAYAAQINGKDGAAEAVRNIYVKPDFVQSGDKNFGDLVAEKLPAYGDVWSGVNIADGQDGMYNPDKAKASFAKAKEALQAQGVQFPIHLDVPVSQTSKSFVNRVQSLKQSIESTLGSDNVVLDIHQLSDDDFNNITYYATTAAQEDWDLSVGVAWEPDYQDPSSFLDVLKTTNSERTKAFMGYDNPNDPAVDQVGLKEYDRLIDEASAETTDLSARYDKYAQAQAWLADSALYIPTTAYSGAATMISRITPFSGAYAEYGDKSNLYYFKYLKGQSDVVTTKEYNDARDKWLKDKKKSNEEAQKEQEKHVEN